jgi:nucleotide-binding universal stress UspA family protein
MTTARDPRLPHPSQVPSFSGRSLVVAVVPEQSPTVALTALSLARAIGAPALYFAYVDTSRYAEEEYPDGSVRHLPVDPGLVDDTWVEKERHLKEQLAQVMRNQDVGWEFRYLGGGVDHALIHLARAVDAVAVVVGARAGRHHRISDIVSEPLSAVLTQRQHRPVLVVPPEESHGVDAAPWG